MTGWQAPNLAAVLASKIPAEGISARQQADRYTRPRAACPATRQVQDLASRGVAVSSNVKLNWMSQLASLRFHLIVPLKR
jgi:hypothetical protein